LKQDKGPQRPEERDWVRAVLLPSIGWGAAFGVILGGYVGLAFAEGDSRKYWDMFFGCLISGVLFCAFCTWVCVGVIGIIRYFVNN
jgi:hypothetical protein